MTWAAYPKCTNAEIRAALQKSAMDLGQPGKDPEFGHGLIRIKDAIEFIRRTGACKAYPAPPSPPPAKKRSPPPPKKAGRR